MVTQELNPGAAERGADIESLLRTPIRFVPHPEFGQRDFPAPAPIAPVPFDAGGSEASSAYLAHLYDTPLLSRDDERDLFTAMNWLKFRAEELRRSLRPSRPAARKVREIRSLLEQAAAVRNRIVQANLRLVVSLARKFADGRHPVDDLASEGHLPLIRAVELFDVSLGNRFSTYATWAIRNHLARFVGLERKRGEFVGFAEDGLFEAEPQRPGQDAATHQEIERQRRLMSELLPRLSPRDQHVMEARFGLNEQDRSHSLSEIAGELGLSKERVRQLVLHAIDRLRDYAKTLSGAA